MHESRATTRLLQGSGAPDPVGHHRKGAAAVVADDRGCHGLPQFPAYARAARAIGRPVASAQCVGLEAVDRCVVAAFGRLYVAGSPSTYAAVGRWKSEMASLPGQDIAIEPLESYLSFARRVPQRRLRWYAFGGRRPRTATLSLRYTGQFGSGNRRADALYAIALIFWSPGPRAFCKACRAAEQS